jgi:alpha-beta hydrolase superfamily lysophospholipase
MYAAGRLSRLICPFVARSFPMPYFDGVAGRVHYRHWPADAPQAAVIFLHGFGEHSGLYDRLAAALTSRGIDLWALDEIGHGLSDGRRGLVGSVDALEVNGRRLTALAAAQRPEVPLVLAGHSLGGVTAALATARDPSPWVATVLSGTPIEAPAWVAELEAGAALSLDANDLSADPSYLDALANDPLAFTESEGGPADALPPAWEELAESFATVRSPVLFVHGAEDPVAPVEGSRRWAAELEAGRLAEFAGGRHDILNDTAHAEVAATIADFVLERRHALTT